MYAAEHARAYPDKPAIIMADSGEVVTFAEYEAAANQVAHLLRETGLRRGDHMAIFMDNDPRMLMCEGGAERSGLYYTCVNSYLSADEVAYIVNDSRRRVVMTSASPRPTWRRGCPTLCPDVERWLIVGSHGGAANRSRPGRRRSHRSAPTRSPTSSWALPMLYSSGTTGRPKGILRPLAGVAPG